MGEGETAFSPGGRQAVRREGTVCDKPPELLQMIGAHAHNLFGCSEAPLSVCDSILRPEAEIAEKNPMATPDHWKIRRAGKRKADKWSAKSPELGSLGSPPAARNNKRPDMRSKSTRGPSTEEPLGREAEDETPQTPASALCASIRAMPGSRTRGWGSDVEDAAARILQRAFARSRMQTILRLEEQRRMMARVQELMHLDASASNVLSHEVSPHAATPVFDTPVFVAAEAGGGGARPSLAGDGPKHSFVGARPRFQGQGEGNSSSSFFSDWSNPEWSMRVESSRGAVTPNEAHDAQKLLDAAWDYSLPEVSPDGISAEARQPFGTVMFSHLVNQAPFPPEAQIAGKAEPKRPVSELLKRRNPSFLWASDTNVVKADKSASTRSIFSARGRDPTSSQAKDEPTRSIFSRAVHKVAKRVRLNL
mmetsp:Transcript_51946/g.126708  ORF Transcript_51946/g.126708 Transcript_51946/m.126708 type:complete len:421 (-) Transcript_51946:244-1506(-)